MRRWIITGAVLLVCLPSILILEENWRGRRAWMQYKHELKAQDMVLDWSTQIPPAVPDDQNKFKAPQITAWFVEPATAAAQELQERLDNPATTTTITNAQAAQDYLAWSDHFQPEFDLMRTACQRPFARMDGDYSQVQNLPHLNLPPIRMVGELLAQRAKCHLILNQPEAALTQLALLNGLRQLTEEAPTGKPMMFIYVMMNAKLTRMYVDVVAEGLRQHVWQEAQLDVLQKQLEQIKLVPLLRDGMIEEHLGSQVTLENLMSESPPLLGREYLMMPRGWIGYSLVTLDRLHQKMLEGLPSGQGIILPDKFADFESEFKRTSQQMRQHHQLSQIFVALLQPLLTGSTRVGTYTQTRVNEALLACALERYRMARGNYPENLKELIPGFVSAVPPDIIGGQPLHYQLSANNGFSLYSVGWNEKDDAGQVVSSASDSSEKYAQGDWVWGIPSE